MKQPDIVRKILHRRGFDLSRWPRARDQWVMDGSLAAVISALRVNCVLDVGANVGQFVELIRTLGYSGRIVSFEPSPVALAKLAPLAARDAEWIVRPVGLAAEPGVGRLYLHPGSDFDSLHAALPEVAEQIPQLKETDRVEITLSTLEKEYTDITAGIDQPRILLKSDTQGHDLDVLAGAPGLPGVVAVMVELSVQPIYQNQPYMTKVMDLLRVEGFSPIAFQPVSRSDELLVTEFDGLFIRPLLGKSRLGQAAQCLGERRRAPVTARHGRHRQRPRDR